jgi:hypothetical protein
LHILFDIIENLFSSAFGSKCGSISTAHTFEFARYVHPTSSRIEPDAKAELAYAVRQSARLVRLAVPVREGLVEDRVLRIGSSCVQSIHEARLISRRASSFLGTVSCRYTPLVALQLSWLW